MTRPTPIRFRAAEAFLASARDMGDRDMIAVAIRINDATNYPRTKPSTDADKATYGEWRAEFGW